MSHGKTKLLVKENNISPKQAKSNSEKPYMSET